jgi:hypothetical protein
LSDGQSILCEQKKEGNTKTEERESFRPETGRFRLACQPGERQAAGARRQTSLGPADKRLFPEKTVLVTVNQPKTGPQASMAKRQGAGQA